MIGIIGGFSIVLVAPANSKNHIGRVGGGAFTLPALSRLWSGVWGQLTQQKNNNGRSANSLVTYTPSIIF